MESMFVRPPQVLFAIFRILDRGRFIHMNIELSLLCAHLWTRSTLWSIFTVRQILVNFVSYDTMVSHKMTTNLDQSIFVLCVGSKTRHYLLDCVNRPLLSTKQRSVCRPLSGISKMRILKILFEIITLYPGRNPPHDTLDPVSV
jgi:hypothetical protein